MGVLSTGATTVMATESPSVNWAETASSPNEIEWPFGKVDINDDDLREIAYEIFFMACRATPGFVGRTPLSYIGVPDGGDGGRAVVPTSRIKRMLGMKTKKQAAKRGVVSPGKNKKSFTTAEFTRQQMRVSEQSDGRLRKALMRVLVGQLGRRSETIILPLELLRHLKPCEFSEATEYHEWQKRNLHILDLGLLVHPSLPLERSNSSALKLREIIKAGQSKPIDTGKNSETMKLLCNSVVALAWRTSNSGCPTDNCHWVDGFPLNLHLYVALLRSCFDVKDATQVIDEVDEILELMKKTWTMLGINKSTHNVCFAWVLFQQFVVTNQIEQDLLGAAITLLTEVAVDAKKATNDPLYFKILSSALASMQNWAERWLLDYHESFKKGPAGLMIDSVLPLALSAHRILNGESGGAGVFSEKERFDSTHGRVEAYIRSSVRNAFAKILESKTLEMVGDSEIGESEILTVLAKDTEDLAQKEKENFSRVLKKWHPVSAGVAAATLHNCYGVVLRQYLNNFSVLTKEVAAVLQTAGKLEKNLVQMAVEDSGDREDGGKGIVKEMVSYEVEKTIQDLLKSWVDARLSLVADGLVKARESETWNPKSKSEAYAHSAVELMKTAKETLEQFFHMPRVSEELVQHLCDGLDTHFQEYVAFASACGSKHNYIPSLPSLTRCNQGSSFLKAVFKVAPCHTGPDRQYHHHAALYRSSSFHGGGNHHDQPRPSTSRGTQRLYIRLNTLYYLLSQLHALQKAVRRRHQSPNHFPTASTHFDPSRATINSAAHHIAEVAAFRLIFLDSASVFYEGLYVDSIADASIRPAVRALKQNLTILSTIILERARDSAVCEIVKASFEAFLMVLLAGGRDRAFELHDIGLLCEDFRLLKQVLVSCGGETVTEESVEREAEAVKGVLLLMAEPTEQLIDDFTMLACEANGGINGGSDGQKRMSMPPTTGRWNRADPNTILRVICHRNDSIANAFLKKNFQLPRRK